MKTEVNACPHCGKSLSRTTHKENPFMMPVTSLKHTAPVVNLATAPIGNDTDELIGETEETPEPVKAKKTK